MIGVSEAVYNPVMDACSETTLATFSHISKEVQDFFDPLVRAKRAVCIWASGDLLCWSVEYADEYRKIQGTGEVERWFMGEGI